MMVDPLLSAAIMDNILASSCLAGARGVYLVGRYFAMGLASTLGHLRPTYLAILEQNPQKEPRPHGLRQSIRSRMTYLYLRPKRYARDHYFPHIPDPNYQSWWGWWHYFHGLDCLDVEAFKLSRQAFLAAAKYRCRDSSNRKAGLDVGAIAKLDKMNAVFPLLEEAICSGDEEVIRQLHDKVSDLKRECMASNERPAPDQVLGYRRLGLIYHRCYARDVPFVPGEKSPKHQTPNDSVARLKKVKNQARELYEQAIKSGYKKVMEELNSNADTSMLEEHFCSLPEGNDPLVLETYALPASPRFAIWLRQHSPRTIFALAAVGVTLWMLLLLWITHVINPAPTEYATLWDKARFVLFFGTPMPVVITATITYAVLAAVAWRTARRARFITLP